MTDDDRDRIVRWFARKLNEAMYRVGASYDEIAKRSEKIKRPVGDFRFEPLRRATIQDHLGSGRRKKLPRREWVFSLIVTLRTLAASRERDPDEVVGTLAEWQARYDEARARYLASGARVDETPPPNRRDADADADQWSDSLALHGADDGVGTGRGQGLPIHDLQQAWRIWLLELATRRYGGRWWPDRYTDVVPDSFAPYLSLEPAARVIRGYEPQFVHGLLQTPEYAEAVIRLEHNGAPAEQIERRLELRMLRQKILRRPNPPKLWVILDEATLYRPYGSRRVLRDQIQHLLMMTEMRDVTIQVMPFDWNEGGYIAAAGPVAILRFAETDVHDVVYREHVSGGDYPSDQAVSDTYVVAWDRLSVRAHQPHETQRMLFRRLREI
ncbi:DUF5753 domain-containing protein [Actinomadura chibensis]|uniref:DUF5753 domain-containing protein n=1 Tax=Actinomadura chibensis TaxID=392828 RepID=A0A5D0NXT5_9ACTN|nr:DUF5753 domain-containing protein [Actinomadura chibensis]TYB48994.1 hypothetical protein FXF69_07565 [Actinomadura chibensis]